MAALGVEHLVDLLPELLGDLSRVVAELALDLLRDLLELGPHELGVGARLLAVEHARADLDRVGDHGRAVAPGLLALTDETGGRLVGDDEAVDEQAIALNGDVGLPELVWRLPWWSESHATPGS